MEPIKNASIFGNQIKKFVKSKTLKSSTINSPNKEKLGNCKIMKLHNQEKNIFFFKFQTNPFAMLMFGGGFKFDDEDNYRFVLTCSLYRFYILASTCIYYNITVNK